jgi:protease-4
VARTRGGLRKDAPVLAALRVAPLARLGRARNSDDPRALLTASWPTLADLPTALGVLDESALRMDPIRLR